MRRFLLFGFAVLVVGAFVATGYVLFTPKIGHATRAQIDAALPASLKVVDKPDPAGEARYAKLAALVRGIDERELGRSLGTRTSPPDRAARSRVLAKESATIDAVARLLAKGTLRYPEREIITSFMDSAKLKSFAKLLAAATADAAERGDRRACARYAVLGLRYGHALLEGGGVMIDGLVAVAAEAIATRAAYEAEMDGGLDAAGRRAVLAELPVQKGPLPELGATVRRDFQAMFMPVLLDSKKLVPETSTGERSEGPSHAAMAGTFDPVETAKLGGAIYGAAIKDASRPIAEQTHEASRLSGAASVGLPQAAEKGGTLGLAYRLRMNMGRNTIGRAFASNSAIFDGLASIGARRAADRNLLRATILLRSGRPADLPDPYGKGKLRIDRKRRIVWSVGEDGKDDGGAIGATYGEKAPDHGRRF